MVKMKKKIWWYHCGKLLIRFKMKHKANIRTTLVFILIYFLKMDADYEGCFYKKHSFCLRDKGEDYARVLNICNAFFRKVDFDKIQEMCKKERMYVYDIRRMHDTIYFTSYINGMAYRKLSKLIE